MSLQSLGTNPYSSGIGNAWRGEFPQFRLPATHDIDLKVDWEQNAPVAANRAKVISLADFARKVDVSKVSQTSLGQRAGVKFLSGLKSAWELSDIELAQILGRSQEEISRKGVAISESEIGEQSQRERIVALVNIHRKLFGLFRDLIVERRWIRHGLPVLDGKPPLTLLADGSFRSLFVIEDIVLAMTSA